MAALRRHTLLLLGLVVAELPNVGRRYSGEIVLRTWAEKGKEIPDDGPVAQATARANLILATPQASS